MKELEESQTLFIINSIDVRGATVPTIPDVTMTLNIETFFYQ
jgi:hypothetical protein